MKKRRKMYYDHALFYDLIRLEEKTMTCVACDAVWGEM